MDKMIGADLVAQENYEFGLEKQLVDSMDKVDRRDRRDEIISSIPNNAFRRGYDNIKWSK